MQAPSVHVMPVSQGTSQSPQLAASVMVSTHALPHSFLPDGHWHAPPLQIWSAAHGMAQSPQLAASVLVLTQAVPHFV